MTKEEVFAYLNTINFTPIINRIVKEKGWLREETEEIVELYKRFLFLQKKYFGKFRLSPTPEIDEVWHAHILYTKEYQQHCMDLFGKFVHHQPEDAMTEINSLSSDNLDQMFNDTQTLYFKEFGEYIPVVRSYSFLGHVLIYFLKLYRRILRVF